MKSNKVYMAKFSIIVFLIVSSYCMELSTHMSVNRGGKMRHHSRNRKHSRKYSRKYSRKHGNSYLHRSRRKNILRNAFKLENKARIKYFFIGFTIEVLAKLAGDAFPDMKGIVDDAISYCTSELLETKAEEETLKVKDYMKNFITLYNNDLSVYNSINELCEKKIQLEEKEKDRIKYIDLKSIWKNFKSKLRLSEEESPNELTEVKSKLKIIGEEVRNKIENNAANRKKKNKHDENNPHYIRLNNLKECINLNGKDVCQCLSEEAKSDNNLKGKFFIFIDKALICFRCVWQHEKLKKIIESVIKNLVGKDWPFYIDIALKQAAVHSFISGFIVSVLIKNIKNIINFTLAFYKSSDKTNQEAELFILIGQTVGYQLMSYVTPIK